MAGRLQRGTHDCLTAACATSLALWGRDPLAGGPPRYRTFTAAQRIIRAAGGILAWSRQTFEGAGMRLTDTPGPGDLALIETSRAKGGATYALCIGTGEYAAKATDGLAIVQGEIIGAWAWE
ncbi:hypothetical protein MBELCI_1549 [Limimaricola cinnabarinus LL-001]|uniref:DUF6950 domain-containing protein n=2 Tax=Limimaricola cinnabarinus TaxID=1125964 RepID=U2Z357_9RHOB|nr:hypothetical protein MBELCI_1549 [Limimaricola cinnabarinus LL-001]